MKLNPIWKWLSVFLVLIPGGSTIFLPIFLPFSVKISVHSRHKPAPPPPASIHYEGPQVYKEIVIKPSGHSHKQSYGDGHDKGTSYGHEEHKVYVQEPHVRGHKYATGSRPGKMLRSFISRMFRGGRNRGTHYKGEKYPTVHEEYPTVHEEYPTVHKEYPTVHKEYPTVHKEYPTVHKEYPTVHKEYPTVHKEYPTVHKEYPTVHKEYDSGDADKDYPGVTSHVAIPGNSYAEISAAHGASKHPRAHRKGYEFAESPTKYKAHTQNDEEDELAASLASKHPPAHHKGYEVTESPTKYKAHTQYEEEDEHAASLAPKHPPAHHKGYEFAESPTKYKAHAQYDEEDEHATSLASKHPPHHHKGYKIAESPTKYKAHTQYDEEDEHAASYLDDSNSGHTDVDYHHAGPNVPLKYAGFGAGVYGDSYAKVAYVPPIPTIKISISAKLHK